MLEVHGLVVYIYVQCVLIDFIKLSKDPANNSNEHSEDKSLT